MEHEQHTHSQNLTTLSWKVQNSPISSTDRHALPGFACSFCRPWRWQRDLLTPSAKAGIESWISCPWLHLCTGLHAQFEHSNCNYSSWDPNSGSCSQVRGNAFLALDWKYLQRFHAPLLLVIFALNHRLSQARLQLTRQLGMCRISKEQSHEGYWRITEDHLLLCLCSCAAKPLAESHITHG